MFDIYAKNQRSRLEEFHWISYGFVKVFCTGYDMPDIAPIVSAFVAARLNQQPISSLPELDMPIDWDMAYDIQFATVAELGGELDGWKLALSTAAGFGPRGFPGPTVGALLKGTVIPSGERLAAADFTAPAVEPEIAVVLGTDLPERGEPYTAAEVRAATDRLHIAVELADTRFADKAAMTDFENIADNNSGALLILGPVIDDVDAACAADITMRLADTAPINGAPADKRPDPFETVAYLANFLTARGMSLKAGETITTGTLAPPTPAEFGENIVEFDGVGTVSFTLL